MVMRRSRLRSARGSPSHRSTHVAPGDSRATELRETSGRGRAAHQHHVDRKRDELDEATDQPLVLEARHEEARRTGGSVGGRALEYTTALVEDETCAPIERITVHAKGGKPLTYKDVRFARRPGATSTTDEVIARRNQRVLGG
jgi:hypothetical protein